MKTCLECHYYYEDKNTKPECRRYPPRIVEGDKMVLGHDKYIKDGKCILTQFPKILINSWDNKNTSWWCGEFKERIKNESKNTR